MSAIRYYNVLVVYLHSNQIDSELVFNELWIQLDICCSSFLENSKENSEKIQMLTTLLEGLAMLVFNKYFNFYLFFRSLISTFRSNKILVTMIEKHLVVMTTLIKNDPSLLFGSLDFILLVDSLSGIYSNVT